MKHLASRKFILAMCSLASAHCLTASGHIAEGVYSAVIIATVGGYLTANVVQKKVVSP